uniref:Uncharacterized protein n=1 Tax=uncultured bacterium A1Q1_fos_2037 TaxID=1256558 RepID=L7VYD5_9BACT|nr:hypothetical protein [uncultured bacterium A1Q1_fos_2037]
MQTLDIGRPHRGLGTGSGVAVPAPSRHAPPIQLRAGTYSVKSYEVAAKRGRVMVATAYQGAVKGEPPAAASADRRWLS